MAKIYKYDPKQTIITGINVLKYVYTKYEGFWVNPIQQRPNKTEVLDLYQLYVNSAKPPAGRTEIFKNRSEYMFATYQVQWTGNNPFLKPRHK